MKQTTRQLAEFLGGVLKGQPDVVLERVASLKNAQPSDLSYAEDKFHEEALKSRAGCLLVASGTFPGRTIIITPNPKLAFALAAERLYEELKAETFVHPTAVIETDALIGRGTRIGAGCTVGAGVRIGDRCILYPRVTVYPGVEIGNNVIIHAGAVIGADGFGFVNDGKRYVKFPQVGRVVIEDDVEIGANTCIDRGSLETTVIRRGTKLDNLIQIAHNVDVGEHTVIAAQTGISGSSTVGDHSILGGQVGIGEHARLDPRTIIGGQGGVLNGKHVRGGEILWGTPVRPLKEFLEQQAHLARLPRWIDEIKRRLFGHDKSVS
ncbi:MAG TPA: UDP-3-O-(3-hydroxymyristoyl)glucosamine N-acyltransferase [Terriglobia bacterium]|nr:UDP-3-O-(3-hydroxymyristoyl)glucosamine N-acyltransferase [Terriglobia bacterium]